mmetsp:Transcript_58856/g.164390  ORF Transcript_58856/g.164390 Transcript_58856/m.164390 type:complete len:341 (+) Transcript_58856:1220-2242(+)
MSLFLLLSPPPECSEISLAQIDVVGEILLLQSSLPPQAGKSACFLEELAPPTALRRGSTLERGASVARLGCNEASGGGDVSRTSCGQGPWDSATCRPPSDSTLASSQALRAIWGPRIVVKSKAAANVGSNFVHTLSLPSALGQGGAASTEGRGVSSAPLQGSVPPSPSPLVEASSIRCCLMASRTVEARGRLGKNLEATRLVAKRPMGACHCAASTLSPPSPLMNGPSQLTTPPNRVDPEMSPTKSTTAVFDFSAASWSSIAIWNIWSQCFAIGSVLSLAFVACLSRCFADESVLPLAFLASGLATRTPPVALPPGRGGLGLLPSGGGACLELLLPPTCK